MATPPTDPSTADRASTRLGRGAAHRRPAWVKALGIAVIVLVVVVVALHLAGLGFGSHMHGAP